MSGLSRDVLKWLQSLDLSTQIRNPKWDFSNGYLIAEIFSWYFPQEVLMHSYYNGESLELKKRNWYLLKNFILKNMLDLQMEDIDGTIHCREGAAIQLIENLYELLTNRKIKKYQTDTEKDYTDYAYQQSLPLHARSTAAKALKNNLRLTEILADQNLITAAQKSQKIINEHIEHRRQERREYPKRFGIKPTLGDRCLRRAEPTEKLNSAHSQTSNPTDILSEIEDDATSEGVMTREPSIHYKEVEVKQLDKSAFYQLPLQSY